MKTKFLLGIGLGACALAWAAKDPVIMVVNGVDVPKSEFEYLYHKNSQQQVSPQTIDEYVDMFVNYRLKVADAMAAGIDTTAAFRQEMSQYRHELAAPYLADSLYLNSLVEEAWRRSNEEVETSHIMIFKRQNPEENAKGKALIDSLYGVLRNGGDFASLANKYSQDRGTNRIGGSLGYIVAGRFPYAFETAAYSLKPGEFSEIVESPVGYHIVKAGERRPAHGQVRASHILLMDGKDGDTDAKKHLIDSIYNIVKTTPGMFESLAMEYSDDKGSARQGGLLPWFTAGQMVPEFEEMAFATPKGTVSEPFRTKFGWHIIYKIDEKGVPSLEEMKPGELQRIGNPQDQRYDMVRRHELDNMMKKHKGVKNEAAVKAIHEYVNNNGLDSLFYLPSATLDGMTLLTVGKTKYDVAAFKESLHGMVQKQPSLAENIADRAIDNFIYRILVDTEETWLENNVADYRNLINEYRNGSLLYEASVKNVWDKASQDKEGLEKYFNAHRADYVWSDPRAKGILVQAKNDSIAKDIVRRYAELPADEALTTLKKEYKGEAQFDRVLAQKGQNALVDNLLFGGEKASPANSAFKEYFMLDGRVVEAPEEVADVRGQVTNDYQEELEHAWLEELHKKYPVVINRKVLKKVK